LPPQARWELLQIGTGGDTRRTLGIPIEVAAAIRVLVEGRPRLIDTGRATLGTRVYHLVNIAETGIGADVSERVNRMPKYLGSSLIYWPPLLRWRAGSTRCCGYRWIAASDGNSSGKRLL